MAYRSVGGGGGGFVHTAAQHQDGGDVDLSDYYGRHGAPGTILFQNAFLAWSNQPAGEDFWNTPAVDTLGKGTSPP